MNKNPTKKLKTLHNFFTIESNDSLIQNSTAETILQVPDGSEANGMNLTVFPFEYLHFFVACFCLLKLITITIFNLKNNQNQIMIYQNRQNQLLLMVGTSVVQ